MTSLLQKYHYSLQLCGKHCKIKLLYDDIEDKYQKIQSIEKSHKLSFKDSKFENICERLFNNKSDIIFVYKMFSFCCKHLEEYFIFCSSVALRNCHFFPGCFQCFATRKIRSVVLRLIKTDENLCRILPVRLLDSRTHSQNVLRHSFLREFIVGLENIVADIRIL